MLKRRRVILYGKSVILGSVAASLGRYTDLEIVTLAPPLPATQGLGALSPDVIIFDLEAAHPDVALSLLQRRPRLLLIGIDPASDQMLLWSGEHAHALEMKDLVQAIHTFGQAGAQPVHPSVDVARWRSRLATRLSSVSMPSRKHTLGLAAVAVVLCGVLIAAQALILPGPSVPLTGTVAGGQGTLQPVLAFAAGVVLGGLVLGLWLRRGR